MMMHRVRDEHNILEQSFIVFQDALGDMTSAPSQDLHEDFSVRFVYWLIFILIQGVINIVALNTLIAIIGNTFDKVQED